MDIATSSSAVETETGAESTGINTQEAGTQTSPSRMNVRIQVKPKTSTKGRTHPLFNGVMNYHNLINNIQDSKLI